MIDLKKISAFVLAASCHLLAVTFTFAQGSYPNPIKSSLGISTIPQFLLALVDVVFLIGVPIIVLFVIYSGFLFVTAGDNESKISKAKFVLLWCLIGATVLLGAKAIAMAIQNTILPLAVPR
jgi:hypothetical protein